MTEISHSSSLGGRTGNERFAASGQRPRDRRGRDLSAPPILQYGFRPFFFLAAVHAGIAIPIWLWMYQAGFTAPGPFPGIYWHVHEMLFGYLAAVIAGFVLTAVPNWTGRLPLSGPPLAGLVLLWAVGRFASTFVALPVLAALLDLAFPAILAAAIWREVIAGRNWRNAPVAAMLTLFGLANAAHYGEISGILPDGIAVHLALGVAAMLIALIGGRIVPSFTRNWLARNNASLLPASFGPLDRASLLATVLALLAWIALHDLRIDAVLLCLAGILLLARLSRWRGRLAWCEPMVLILHLGYFWLGVSLLMLGGADLVPDFVPESAALHALTAGAIGTMTLAVMTRASLGHTGRPIKSDSWIAAIYASVTLGALLRVAAPFLLEFYTPLLIAGGSAWSLAFILFAVRFGPMLWTPRLVSSR